MSPGAEFVAYFTRYAAAFDAFDAAAVARFCHVPCTMIRAGQVDVLTTAGAISANMEALMRHHRAQGYERASFDGLRVAMLDRDLALVTVSWTIHLRAPAKALTFRNTYELARMADDWRILVSTTHQAGGVGG